MTRPFIAVPAIRASKISALRFSGVVAADKICEAIYRAGGDPFLLPPGGEVAERLRYAPRRRGARRGRPEIRRPTANLATTAPRTPTPFRTPTTSPSSRRCWARACRSWRSAAECKCSTSHKAAPCTST